MVTAVILVVGVMMLSAGPIIAFVNRHVFVEMINLRVRRIAVPVHLHEPYA